MTERRNDGAGRLEERLHAYYDDELSGFARWRFKRALRRSPELQHELRGLATMGDLLRESAAAAPAPQLWDSIALRLPAADARREDSPSSSGSLGWLLKPAGALAAAAGVALAVSQSLLPPEAGESASVVRWVDSGGRNVMVLDSAPDTTIIWVLESLTEEASRGDTRAAV